MRKILIGLLSFLIAGLFFKYIQSNKDPANELNKKDFLTETSKVKTSEVLSYIVDNESGFSSSWIMKEISYADYFFSYNQFGITFTQQGQSESFYQEGILWEKDQEYKIKGNVDSQYPSTVNIKLKDQDEILSQYMIEVNGSKQFEFSFISSINNDWTGSVEIQLISEYAQNNEIKVKDFKLIEVDSNHRQVRVNHLGYRPNDPKVVVFPYTQGDFFDVVDAQTEEIVYTGAIVNASWDDTTNERNSYGVFSVLNQEGEYYIQTQILGKSSVFEIKDDLYKDVLDDALKVISYQRCGIDIDSSWAKGLEHEACHLENAILHEDSQYQFDVSGGWHDAGDYGRYIETGVKTTNDLLFAYYRNPSTFSDDLNIPESENGIPDILDEVRYELEWMLKMQTSWGGVYNKVTTPSFASDVLPEDDEGVLYVLPVETMTTGGFAGTMAVASIIYKDVDIDFSLVCLEASRKAWDYLRWTDKVVDYKNPADFMTGSYRDTKDSDERFFASIALWTATGESQYLDYAMQVFANDESAAVGTSWSDVGAYGSYLYLINDDVDKESELYQKLQSNLSNQAQGIITMIENSGYRVGLEHYSWGSNGKILNQAMILLMLSDIEGSQYPRELAAEQLNYIFGRNGLDRSFVIGYGENYPQNPHHRISRIQGGELSGAIVGGVNSDRDDYLLSQLPDSVPKAKMYIDAYDSYSTNEVTIYWNSSLVYVLSYFR